MPADSVLAKAKFSIPLTQVEDTVCVTIPCPNDDISIFNLLTAIAELGLWSNYQLADDRIAKPTADRWTEIWRIVEESLCNCGLRNGPSGLEQFDDNTGTWIPIQGNSAQGDPRTDGTVPSPWPIPPSGQTGNCLAAANIVGVFQSMQVDAGTKLTDLAGFATVLVMFESYLDLALPLIGEVIQLATEMGASAIDAGAITWNDAFDPATQGNVYHALQCSISCFAESDGRVTSAIISDILSDFGAKLPGLVSNLSERALWALFVPDFFASQGPNGLTKLAKMSNISSADCSDCDCGWCVEYDFTIEDYSWISDFSSQGGVYVALQGWIASLNSGNLSCYIRKPFSASATRYEITYRTNDTNTQSDFGRLRDAGSTVRSINGPGGSGLGVDTVSNGTFASTLTDELWATWEVVSPGTQITIRKIRVFGDGTAPLGEPICP